MKNKTAVFPHVSVSFSLTHWCVCLCDWFVCTIDMNEVYLTCFSLLFSCFHSVMLFFSVCPPALTLPPLFHLWWQGGTYNAFHVQVQVCCYGGC